MANDTGTPSGALEGDSFPNTETFFSGDAQDSVFGTVQLAQADPAAAPVQAAAPGAPQTVAIPAGADVVRVAVTPGAVLLLGEPFIADAVLIGRIGDGNLAIRVGNVTVILEGYVDANEQAPVTIEAANGQPIDIATMLASTDPEIDIQTAAGPGDAAGPQGADNSGAFFSQFGPGGGLGGFTGVGAQDATELSYGLIDNSIRQELAEAPLLGTGGTFGFSVGAISGAHSERFFRDPAQTTYLGDFAQFMIEYQDAVEHPGSALFAGWADFHGTGATGGDFQEYLSQTQRTVIVDASFTGSTGDLVLDGIAPGLTSNGSPLHVEMADQGHTLFVRRDSDNGLVAVVHVEGPDSAGEFTIDTYMINRLDHPHGDTGDAGRDEMIIGVEFTVYDGPSPYLQEGEGNDVTPPSSPALEGSFEVTFADDVPLFDDVTYHNLDGGAGGGDGLPPSKDSTSTGLIDEDWLKGGANDTGKDGTSNAGDNGDTAGGASVTGQVNITFGADGPSQTDNPNYEAADKHAFTLDTSAYTQGQPFPYGDNGLQSGGKTLVVLEVGPDHLVVGLPSESFEVEGGVLVSAETPIFALTLNQATGAFTFNLYGPLDHGDLIFANSEETIPLDFGVTALDDDGDYLPASIHIEVNDDLPVARDDSDTVAAGTYGPETGNVLTGAGTDSPGTGSDIQGADGAKVTGASSTTGGNQSADINGDTTVVGAYGTLTLSADGSYSYTRDPGTKGGVDDVFTYTLTDQDGDTSTATLTIHIGDAGVTIDTPVAGSDGTVVDEQGLPERSGEPAGSGEIADGDGTDDDDTSESTSGVVTITAPDGVASLQIDGHTALTAAELADLGANPVTYTDATGELTLTGFDSGTGKLSYTYTLLDNTLVDPDSVSFALKVTDIDGSEGNGTLTVAIIDDAPTANPDADAANSGATITGNVETNDVFGADGKSGSGVVGVAKGTDTGTPLSGGTGVEIAGDFGKLTLNADGSYTYQANPNVSGIDHFVYTIADGDGDPSTTTLDITVTKVGPAIDIESVTVNEAALDTTQDAGDLAASAVTGSSSGSTDETKTGQLTLEPGVTVVNGNDQIGLFGVLHVNPDGSFTYTLTSNLLPGALNDGTNTVPNAEVFTVTIQDGDGNTAIDTIRVNVTDDVTTANADTDSVDNVANTATGNVFTGVDTTSGLAGADVEGADGARVTKLQGVNIDADNSNGLEVIGQHGILTMTPTGSYTYARFNDAPLTATDTFTYTLTDKDGDASPATLTISIDDKGVQITDLTPSADGGDVMVDEDDLADGSDTSKESTTGTGSFTISAPDGVDEVTIAGVKVIDNGVLTATLTITTPLGNTLTVTDYSGGVISYSYTLNDNTTHSSATGEDSVYEDFPVVLKDVDGDIANATLSAGIVDDVPTANADTDGANSGASINGNVETNDVFGADGKAGGGVVGVSTGSNIGSPVAGGTGVPIVTSLGTLTLNADGTYTYVANANVSGVDHFVYTIEDGDGDKSTTTLDITVANVTPKADTQIVTVNEAALDTTITGNDLAASTKTGSNPASPDETKTGQLVLEPGITATAGDYSGTYGKLHVNSDGSFTYTLTTNLLVAGAGTNTVLDAEIFNIQIQDASGNTATDTIKVNVIDDVPLAFNPVDQSLLNSPLGGTITGGLDIAGHTGADGLGSIVFSGGTDGSKATLADGTTAMLYQTHNILLTGFGTTALTGIADINNNGKIDGGETTVFTVKLDGAADSYEFNLLKPIDNGAKVDFTDLSNARAGNGTWLGVGADAGAATTRDLLYTGEVFNSAGGKGFDTVNTSKNDIGSNNQWIDPNEGVRMDFVNGLVTDGGSFNFGDHYQVQDFQFTIAQVQGGGTTTVKVTVFDVQTKTNTTATTDAAFLLQDQVAITAGELLVLRGGLDITGTLTISYAGGSASIQGLQTGDVIQIDEATGFDRLLVESVGAGNTPFGITAAKVLNTTSGVDLDAKFETTLTDGDGDTSKGQYIGINLQTDDGQAHTFTGGTGNDTMHGGSGNDTLSGGAGGSDYIFGDAGNDTMLYDSADKYDGGAGFDRLLVQTGGNTITYDNAKFLGIEMVDLGDANDRSGAVNQNTLALTATDVVGTNAGTVAGHQISFFVIGDTTGPTADDRDNVQMSGFGSKIATGSFADPATGLSHTYDVYQSTANAAIKVAIEQGLDVI